MLLTDQLLGPDCTEHVHWLCPHVVGSGNALAVLLLEHTVNCDDAGVASVVEATFAV